MEKSEKLYLDLHVIQTVPPSCVNRDDTGSPKTAIYGGVRRARVSSQSWKHEMRRMFKEKFAEELGIRTKKVVEIVAKEIQNLDASISNENAMELAKKALKSIGISINKDGDTSALFFINKVQASRLAEFAMSNDVPKGNPKKADKERLVGKYKLNIDSSPDMLLFGRMVAGNIHLGIDATAQVAHAISTHRVDNEYDYFTAVDDLQGEESSGAGMISVVEFNSSTLYRYATVAVHNLYAGLGHNIEDTKECLFAFVKTFMLSMPTGKQNTFANRTLPDGVIVTLRKDQPINMVGAFECPIKAGNDGYVTKSIDALVDYADDVYTTFASKPEKAWYVGKHEVNAAYEKVNLADLLKEIGNTVEAELK